jgi:hypothetical protein
VTAYAWVRLVHVVIAVVGLGTITAIAVVARAARSEPPAGVGRLAGAATASLVLMLLSGAALDALADRAFDGLWWFRLAALSMVPAGAAVGRIRVLARRWAAGQAAAGAAVARTAWVASALVAWIAVLMELRPFA